MLSGCSFEVPALNLCFIAHHPGSFPKTMMGRVVGLWPRSCRTWLLTEGSNCRSSIWEILMSLYLPSMPLHYSEKLASCWHDKWRSAQSYTRYGLACWSYSQDCLFPFMLTVIMFCALSRHKTQVLLFLKMWCGIYRGITWHCAGCLQFLHLFEDAH